MKRLCIFVVLFIFVTAQKKERPLRNYLPWCCSGTGDRREAYEHEHRGGQRPVDRKEQGEQAEGQGRDERHERCGRELSPWWVSLPWLREKAAGLF